jgi:hypothetical protein
MSELVSGIIHDAQTLLTQQLTLFKQEMRQDLQEAREAAQFMGTAVALLGVGGLLLSFMLVYALHEVAQFQLWASFGIVGGVMLAIGAAVAVLGRVVMRSFNPLPEKTAAGLEENLEWKTKPR